MTITIGMRLCQLASEQGFTLPQAAREIGVGKSTIYHWRSGTGSPNVRNATSLACLVRRRIVAVDAGKVVASGEELANLVDLRVAAGLSQNDLAAILGIDQVSVSQAELRSGPNTYLATCQKYLEGCSYKVGLAPVVSRG